MASIRFDSTNAMDTVFSDPTQDMARIDFSVGGNYVYALGANFDFDNPDALILGAVVYRGTYNETAGGFDWEKILVNADFAQTEPGVVGQQAFTLGNMAWSSDGMTGYVVFLGRDLTDDFFAVYPIVYKSTDAGMTWAKEPGFDFASIPTFTDLLAPSNTGSVLPQYTTENSLELFVDANNMLHIVCEVLSGASNDPDSTGFFITDEDGNYPMQIFDTYQTGTGWDAIIIDTVMAYPVTATETPYVDAVTWDARIQVSSNPERDKFFMIWMDTDPLLSTSNLFPNILGKGWSLEGAMTETKNFTEGGTEDANNYWMFVSNVALVDDAAGMYNIPVTTSEVKGGVLDGILPTTHYYVSGIQFSESDFAVGVENVLNSANFSVSPNYPNPFNGVTSFTIQLASASEINIKVTNLLGETVFNNNLTLNSGAHSISFNQDKLSSGVYFYNVTVGNESITKKMIIE
jgi:hypothetical protein